MTLRILHDVHAGVSRGAGTTPATQLGLRQYILDEFQSQLPPTGDLMILGDLFDTGSVPISDVLKMFVILRQWLVEHPGNVLYNVAGNHDLNKISNVLSSFQFMSKFLGMMAAPGQYVHIEEPTMTPYGYVIPHMLNQDLFNIAVAAVPHGVERLFLHCNYDNNFAAQSDQSLNISPEQVEATGAQVVIVAHEHHPRTVGRVRIPGSQIATSVSDWQQPGDRQFLEIRESGEVGAVVCQRRDERYVEMPYDQLEVTDHQFVKVTGRVAADQVNAAIASLNRLRTRHPAFVIGNGIQTINSDNQEVIAQSLSNIRQFNIWDSLRTIMTPEEMTTLEEVNARN